MADVNDMANDINQANIPNIVASVTNGSNLTLTNIAGQDIIIVNVAKDANGNNFAGPASVTSLPLITIANSTTHALKLERLDGGPLTIRDIQGTFLSDAGVMSGQTGRYALGLNIEQGLRASATTVVGNMGGRDALHALVGDQCHVINDGNGEWALFVYDGAQWTKVSGERSVAVDARTISQEIILPGTTVTIGTITEGRRILNVSVSVTTVLVDAPDFDITIGGASIWRYIHNGAAGVGTYTVESELVTAARSNVVVNIPSNTASGIFKVEVTYV